ncbi:FG-GAP repeat domain-containing protein [Pelagihabitans pacificus]|nr:VCBS repeat-containing protein [Pelagihabitans pacificus]
MKYLQPLLFLIFIVSTAIGNAQDKLSQDWHYIQVDSTKQMWGDWAEPEWLRYFGLDAGDVDSDGNMDIISGRYIYHNPGGGMESTWKRTVLDDNVDGILYIDVDGDPYADIIAMALPDLYWYEATNENGTRYQRKLIGQVPATSHVNSQGFEKAQLVAGGPSEFVIAGNGDIYAIAIPDKEADTSDWKVTMICKNTSDEGIGVGDIDGDGDLDIAAGRRPDGEDEPKILVWYENPGNIDSLWKPTIVGESIHPIDRVEIADVNGDGKADIVVTEERYPGLEPDANFWWFGQQDLDTWQRNKIVTQFSINNLDITDIDNDGDTDLLTAEHKGTALELQLWENNGAGVFTKTVIDTGKENHLGTQWVDLDADGDLDIIGAGWDQHQYMHVWRNDAIKSLKTGMLYKEYPWTPIDASDDGKFLRVGGKLDYSLNKDHFPKKKHKNGFIKLGHEVDLNNAIGAEVLVERVQSHEDTKDLSIQFNEGKPILLPEPTLISEPATDYMFHTNIRMPVPLTHLKQGVQNSFKLMVAEDQSWDWPQNLVYAVVLRIYYKPVELPGPTKLIGIKPGDFLQKDQTLSLESTSMGDIVKVDYVGLYEDVNVQGDGKYRQWQFRHHRGAIANHLGSSTKAPFEVVWNTEWLPDQSMPVQLTALVTHANGFVEVIEPIHGLGLNRTSTVALVKPYGQEPFWTTRNGEHGQYLDIPLAVSENDKAILYWNSWSPCYSEGIRLNGTVQIPDRNTPCYDAYWHEEALKNVGSLKMGRNRLTTLKTPLHEGQMVHGMDVQWPGIMVKVKKENQEKSSIHISEGSYENRPHYIVHTQKATYYYDQEGGGFSRIIDRYGNDWVGYKTEPWDQYPASAASAFRGLPNLVFNSDDGGAGHPGHDKCVSEIVSENKIKTTSKSGLWEWEWIFHDDYAVLNILKVAEGKTYWFLYEGTPGGNYEPAASTYGTDSAGPRSDIPDFYKGSINWGNYQWAYFNKNGVPTTFYLAQVTPDQHVDMMSYLGDTADGASSKDGMTVFGFGRDKDTRPLLVGKNSFVIGLTDYPVRTKESHQRIATHINKLIKP